MEQNKEKRKKRNKDHLRDLWDNIKCTNIWNIGVPKEVEKEKGPEKIYEDIIVEISLTREKKQSPTSREYRESHTGKPKEEHAETHINQKNK